MKYNKTMTHYTLNLLIYSGHIALECLDKMTTNACCCSSNASIILFSGLNCSDYFSLHGFCSRAKLFTPFYFADYGKLWKESQKHRFPAPRAT